jgi:hypothetical protein
MLFREVHQISLYVCVYAVFNASITFNKQWRITATLLLSLTSFIMVQLKPEIYQMVVESMLATDGPPDFETKLDQQRNLARMMRVSKVGPSRFYE